MSPALWDAVEELVSAPCGLEVQVATGIVSAPLLIVVAGHQISHFTIGVGQFGMCQRHTAKALLHTPKPLLCVAHGKWHTADSIGKEDFCRVPFIGHTVKSLPST